MAGLLMAAQGIDSFEALAETIGISKQYISQIIRGERRPDVNDPQAFAARVTGDSMSPKYNTGDIVIFSPNRQARPGQDVFVRFETGATTFKRFYLDDEATLRLQPINNAYPARTVPRREVTGLWPAVYRIEQINP